MYKKSLACCCLFKQEAAQEGDDEAKRPSAFLSEMENCSPSQLEPLQ
jgi:hypothetical protein